MIFDGGGSRRAHHMADPGRGIGEFAFNMGFNGGLDPGEDEAAAHQHGQNDHQSVAPQQLGPDVQIFYPLRQCGHNLL